MHYVNGTLSQQVLWWAKSRLNAEVEEREEKRDGKWAVSLLQPVSTQKPKYFV